MRMKKRLALIKQQEARMLYLADEFGPIIYRWAWAYINGHANDRRLVEQAIDHAEKMEEFMNRTLEEEE